MSLTVSIDLDARMPLGLYVHRGERDAAIRMSMARSPEFSLNPAEAVSLIRIRGGPPKLSSMPYGNGFSG